MNTIKILHIDENLLFREGIKAILSSHSSIELVGSVGSYQDALTQASVTKPNIILLELNLENKICTELIPKLLNESPLSKILIVTNSIDINTRQLALRKGAIGILEKKSTSESTLLKAIEKVLDGEAWIDRVTVAHLINGMSNIKQNGQTDPVLQRINNLTDRELQVISLICKGMKAKDLAASLVISESTARHYLSTIYTKLDLNSLGDLIIFAFKHQLVELPE